VIADSGVVDVWRVKHPQARQDTWVKVLDGNTRAGRLDRVFITHSFNNRLLNRGIWRGKKSNVGPRVSGGT